MGPSPNSFVAIDFETADTGRDSACAVALIRVDGATITRRETRLIRPPRPSFQFTHIHGIRWVDVQSEPSFAQVWPELEPVLDGASFLVAHNASFDHGVLRACCYEADLQPPALPFACTMRLARQAWGLRPTRLSRCSPHSSLIARRHSWRSPAHPQAATAR